MRSSLATALFIQPSTQTRGPAALGRGEEAGFGGLVPVNTVPTPAVLGPHWLPYFEVDDGDAAVADVERLGGELTLEPMDMPGVGKLANVADPYGAHFAVIKSAEAPGS